MPARLRLTVIIIFPISGVLTSGHGQLRQGHANYLAAVESLKTPPVPNNMSGTLNYLHP